MKPEIHYIVRHQRQVINGEGHIDIDLFEKLFVHEQPIQARKAAFEFYADYQTWLDENRTLHNPLRPQANNVEVSLVFVPEDPSKYFEIEDSGSAETYSHEVVVHHQFGDDPFEVSELMANLDEEYMIYDKILETDIYDEAIKVPFWDYEVYYTHAYERHIWTEEFRSSEEEWFEYHTIMKTPFDWSPYAKANWWDDPAFENHLMDNRIAKRELNERQNHAKLIAGGESETVEFKPAMFKTIPGKDKNGNPKPRDMRLEIAQAICSFMNGYGGNIYIGVDDEGEIIGVDLEGRTKDEYIRHFSQLKNSYFSSFSYIIHGRYYIESKFETIEGKEVFVIQVKENKKEPVFLYNKERPYSSAFQFYVREGTSSIPLYDPLRLTRYIEEKWWRRKYQQ